MNKEELTNIVCQSTSDYDILNNAYDYIEKLEEENKQLKEKINTYENPEDMTLMFMWCDEKAKYKIKQLKEVIEEVRVYVEDSSKQMSEDATYYLLQILDKAKENKNENN